MTNAKTKTETPAEPETIKFQIEVRSDVKQAIKARAKASGRLVSSLAQDYLIMGLAQTEFKVPANN